MEKFYILKPDGGRFGTKWAYGESILPKQLGDYEYCPVCGKPVTLRKWLPPYRIRLSSAKPEKWGDFLWGVDFQLMVSKNFFEIYNKEKLSGIREFSTDVNIEKIGRSKEKVAFTQLPIYFLVDIPWDGANQDDIASGVEWYGPKTENVCPYHSRDKKLFYKQDKIVIDIKTWKGDDIFQARGAPLSIIVTEKFYDIAQKYKLKNAIFIPAEKYAYNSAKISPN